ncbi:uncharacterized protein LOC128670188 isoform X2 [Plodia interpunctella]|nr:uncharacterized protein LOC128670188 isoform X2 [Plodia interpunctella]
MCVNQATYCYPNGCLKKSDDSRKDDQETPDVNRQILKADSANALFLVDNTGNQVAKVNEDTPELTTSTTSEPQFGNNMQLYTFDNYKPIYKYRKLPKVQMQYNLREQIKNTKSNVYTDVTSNRWPLSKIKQVTIGKSYQPDMTIDRPSRRSKYFRPIPSLVPRFSKRESIRTSNLPENITSDFMEIKRSEIPEKFSLEKLINDLIESSIDQDNKNNNTDRDITKATNIDIKTKSMSSNNRILPLSTEALDLSSTIYETTTVDISNNTKDHNNKTLDYEDDSPPAQTQIEMLQNIYNDDSIETLSKRIEKLNNTSYEILTMNNDHIEAVTEDSRTTEANEFAISSNRIIGIEGKSIQDNNKLRNSTSLSNN